MKQGASMFGWVWLRHGREIVRQYRSRLVMSNLRTVRFATLIGGLLCLCVGLALVLMTGDWGRAALLTGACGVCLGCFFFAGTVKRPEQYGRLNLIMNVMTLTAYGVGVYMSTFGTGNEMAVTAIWMVLFVQMLFDRFPLEGGLLALLETVALLVCSYHVKDFSYFRADCLHSLLILVISQVCAVNKAGARLNALIAEDQLRESNYALYHSSTVDALTGLLNRKMALSRLEEINGTCLGAGKALICCVLDVDYFKQYNDLYGHPAGDVLLRELGGVLTDFAEAHAASVGRIGGEEFLAIWEAGALSPEAGAEALRRGVEALNRPHAASDAAEVATVSVGVYVGAAFPPRQRDEAYVLADKALYRAKEEGRNRCWLYDGETGVYRPLG